MINPPNTSTTRETSSRMAMAAYPDELAKLSIRLMARMPAAAALRTASNTDTLRPLICGQAWIWASTAPLSRSAPGITAFIAGHLSMPNDLGDERAGTRLTRCVENLRRRTHLYHFAIGHKRHP